MVTFENVPPFLLFSLSLFQMNSEIFLSLFSKDNYIPENIPPFLSLG